MTKIHTPDLMNAATEAYPWRMKMPLPTPHEIAGLQEGDIVSVGDRTYKERFWVIISEINDSGFVGIVNNDLVRVPTYNDTDKIAFKSENIYIIYRGH